MEINQAQVIFDELKQKIDITKEEEKAYHNVNYRDSCTYSDGNSSIWST